MSVDSCCVDTQKADCAAGNIPTIQELELQSSRDDNAFSAFGEHDATAAGVTQ